MDAIFGKVEKDDAIPVTEINLVYHNTVANSPLRKAFTDIMVYRSKMPGGINTDTIMKTCLAKPDNWPKEACLDVIAEMSVAWTKKAN
jgi:hypothetical protein